MHASDVKWVQHAIGPFQYFKIQLKTTELSTMHQGIKPTNTVPTTTSTVHFSQQKYQIHMCSRECV